MEGEKRTYWKEKGLGEREQWAVETLIHRTIEILLG